MALDTDTRDVLRQLAELGIRPLHELSPEAAREQVARARPPAKDLRPMRSVQDLEAAVDGRSPVRVRVLVPSETPAGFIVYYHGGGWVVGAVEDYEPLCREIAAGTNCVVAVVDYRLAPEHPFPAAVEDACTALSWARDAQRDWAADTPLVVAGDSAGGNLAAVAALHGRDTVSSEAATSSVALQVLLYPVLDCDTETASYRHSDNQLLLNRDTMRWFWRQYAPQESVRLHPDASPLRATDLTVLPPTLIATAEHDVLRDEAESYAARLQAAGIPVTLRNFEGHMHGFLSRFAAQPSARAALDTIIEQITAGIRANVTTGPTPGVDA